MKLYTINTGNFKIDGGAMFGVVPKILWQKQYPSEENNLTNWAMRSLLIDDGEHKILIDNGLGEKYDDKFKKIYHLNGEDTLEKSLKNHGFTYEDITDVILTHLHFDHCGGSTRYNENGELALTFPNAKYWIGKRQWILANNPNRREKASFFKENFSLIEKENKLNLIVQNTFIYPNIELRLFEGHTTGQLVPFIHHPKSTLVFTADYLPSIAHIPMPYIPSYDTQPLESLREKEIFFDEAIKNNYILFFEHDLNRECCTLQETEKGVRAKEIFDLKDKF